MKFFKKPHLWAAIALSSNLAWSASTDSHEVSVNLIRSLKCEFSYSRESRNAALIERSSFKLHDWSLSYSNGAQDFASTIQFEESTTLSRFNAEMDYDRLSDPEEIRDRRHSPETWEGLSFYVRDSPVGQLPDLGSRRTTTLASVKNQRSSDGRQYLVYGSKHNISGEQKFEFFGLANCALTPASQNQRRIK